MHEYHTLQALRYRESAEQVEQAEMDAAIAEHEAWKAARRPALKSHEEFMAPWLGRRLRDRTGEGILIGSPMSTQGRRSPVPRIEVRSWLFVSEKSAPDLLLCHGT